MNRDLHPVEETQNDVQTITVNLEFPQTSAAASRKRKRGAALNRKSRATKKT